MININKYNTLKDYLESDNIVSDECRVSQIGKSANMSVLFTPPTVITSNRVMTASQLSKDDVAVVVKDKLDGKIKFIPQECFSLSALDQTQYEVKPWIRYRGEGKLQLMIYKSNNGSQKWGRNNYYKVSVNTESAGSISMTVTINGTARTASYSYSAGASLDTIVTGLNGSFTDGKMTSKDGESGMYIAHASGEDFIRVAVGTYSNSTLSVTGGTMVDLSTSAKYRGAAIGTTHHGWANQLLTSQFSADNTLVGDLRAAYGVSGTSGITSTSCYCRHGEDLGYCAGANLTKSKAYATSNGSTSTSNAFAANAYGLKPATFESWSAGVAEFGTWENYMIARMVDVDRAAGVNNFSKNNGAVVTDILANITTEDFDGTFVPAFPAAYAAKAIYDGDLCPDGAGLPTAHQIACFMCDTTPDRFTYINQAITKLSGTGLSYTSYYWSSVESYSYSAWRYTGYYGTLDLNGKCGSFTVRPALAFSV